MKSDRHLARSSVGMLMCNLSPYDTFQRDAGAPELWGAAMACWEGSSDAWNKVEKNGWSVYAFAGTKRLLARNQRTVKVNTHHDHDIRVGGVSNSITGQHQNPLVSDNNVSLHDSRSIKIHGTTLQQHSIAAAIPQAGATAYLYILADNKQRKQENTPAVERELHNAHHHQGEIKALL